MPYTPIIVAADLKTHFYVQVLDEITREDSTIVDTAIESGIAEIKVYLRRYDLLQLFGSLTEDAAATFSDPYLTNLAKDVIAWNLINLANPNMSYENCRKRYEDAIKALRDISKGITSPPWPYLDTTGLETPPGISVSVHSHDKRTNGY